MNLTYSFTDVLLHRIDISFHHFQHTAVLFKTSLATAAFQGIVIFLSLFKHFYLCHGFNKGFKEFPSNSHFAYDCVITVDLQDLRGLMHMWGTSRLHAPSPHIHQQFIYKNRLMCNHPSCRPTLFILLSANLMIIMEIMYISDGHSFLSLLYSTSFTQQIFLESSSFVSVTKHCILELFFPETHKVLSMKLTSILPSLWNEWTLANFKGFTLPYFSNLHKWVKLAHRTISFML